MDVLDGTSAVEAGGTVLEGSLLSVPKITGELDVALAITLVEVLGGASVSFNVLIMMKPIRRGQRCELVHWACLAVCQELTAINGGNGLRGRQDTCG